MTPHRSTSLARTLALVAGGADVAAGGAMAVIPEWSLAQVRLSVPAADGLVYVRFLGAMVAAVGAVYLAALVPGGRYRLRNALVGTIFFRVAAGSFAAIAWGLGWLEWPWLAVPAVDFALVAAQAALLAQGAGLHE